MPCSAPITRSRRRRGVESVLRAGCVWLPAVLLAYTSLGTQAEEAKVVIEPVRQFGYVIGDQVEVRAAIRVPAGYRLDAGSLPQPGRVNAFLELRDVAHGLGVLEGLRQDYEQPVLLRFLVVNSATEVRTAQTPALSLRFRRQGAPDFAAPIPTLELTVSPLTPMYVAGLGGLQEMQPDVQAPRIAARGPQVRLLLYALAALALAGYVAWRLAWVPSRMLARRPFARAAADLRRMSGDGSGEAAVTAARRMHRAFDDAAGFAVASPTLERLFATQPWSLTLESEIRQFFSASARFFYAGDRAALLERQRLVQLARALAELEPRKPTLQ